MANSGLQIAPVKKPKIPQVGLTSVLEPPQIPKIGLSTDKAPKASEAATPEKSSNNLSKIGKYGATASVVAAIMAAIFGGGRAAATAGEAGLEGTLGAQEGEIERQAKEDAKREREAEKEKRDQERKDRLRREAVTTYDSTGAELPDLDPNDKAGIDARKQAEARKPEKPLSAPSQRRRYDKEGNLLYEEWDANTQSWKKVGKGRRPESEPKPDKVPYGDISAAIRDKREELKEAKEEKRRIDYIESPTPEDSAQGNDLTTQIAQLEADIKTLTASRPSIIKILGRAGKKAVGETSDMTQEEIKSEIRDLYTTTQTRALTDDEKARLKELRKLLGR